MAPKESSNPKSQTGRIRLVLIFLTLFGLLVIGRLFYLQSFKHDYYVRIAATQQWARDEIPAQRGNIYVKDDDVDGGLYSLAENKSLSLVYASPEDIKDKQGTANALAPLIGLDSGKILDLFNNNHTYVVLAHQLTFDQSTKIKALGLAGIFLADEPTRYYPEGTLASQILGYVDGTGAGKYGLEQYFNNILQGVPGLYRAEVSANGKTISFGHNVSVAPKDGTSLVLTINRDVQYQAEQYLDAAVKKYSAENGSIIVEDPHTGAIIAMANYPTFDPNNYKDVKNYSLFKNLSVSDVYEPGSIFKVITMAAGLDAGKIQPDTKYTDTGSVVLNGSKIMNALKKAYGTVDMTYVLEQSLNTGSIWVMQQMGKDTFYSYIKKFGFGSPTGIEQPVEGTGMYFSPTEVDDHTYATMTFGQSISTTPIRMITAFAAIANSGKMIQPHLVDEIIDPSGKITETKTKTVRQVISKDAALKDMQMMVAVVDKGEGFQAAVKGYKVAGKTGTAQVPAANGKGYDPNRNIGSFIGIGPAGSPKYVVMAKIDSPKGIPWAEESAAPVVGQMFDFLFKYYQIPPTEPIK